MRVRPASPRSSRSPRTTTRPCSRCCAARPTCSMCTSRGPSSRFALRSRKFRRVSAIDLKGLLAGAGNEHDRWARTINPQFVRVLRTIGFDRTWAHADGAYLYDTDGTRYLDMLGGFGMYNVGRNNPRIRAALVEALELDTPGMLAM